MAILQSRRTSPRGKDGGSSISRVIDMRTVFGRMALVAALSFCGCVKRAERPPAQVANVPTSRAEALNLMQAVDAEGAARDWDANVTAQVRRRMTGRLLSAGMMNEEVERWIVSPIAARDGEKKEEGLP